MKSYFYLENQERKKERKTQPPITFNKNFVSYVTFQKHLEIIIDYPVTSE